MIQSKANAKSLYVPFLHFGEKTASKVNERFIKPKVKSFFDIRGIKTYDSINVEHHISDLDFNNVELSYFYEVILSNIRKNSGSVTHNIKYCITLDENVTNKTCEKTFIKYSEILLYKQPIFYFIYFNFNEIIEFVRQR